MSIFDIFKKRNIKEQEYLVGNQDWQMLAQMLFRYINSNPTVNPIVTKTDYITKAYAYNSTVYSIISLRANAAKGIPWLVYRVKDRAKLRQYSSITNKALNLGRTISTKAEALEEVEGTPINRLLKEPNPQHSFQ